MESLRKIVRKVISEVAPLSHGYDKKNRTVYPDLGNFFIQKVYFIPGQLFQVHIFSPDGHKVGELDTRNPKKWMLSYNETPKYPETFPNDAKNWQVIDLDFKGSIKNAVRLVFLKLQKPISEGQGTVAQSGQVFRRLQFKDIADWRAVLLEEDGGKYWMILNAEGKNVGELDEDGVLRFDLNATGYWEIADDNFEFDEAGIKQATRYVFLKTQKPLNEEKTFIQMPDVANYTAMKMNANVNRRPLWRIYDDKQKEIIRVFESGKFDYVRRGEYFDSGWISAPDDVNFGFDETGIKQVARWYYLNVAQKPIPQAITESTEGVDYFKFPDVDGWMASRYRDIWTIFDDELNATGAIIIGKDGRPQKLQYALEKPHMGDKMWKDQWRTADRIFDTTEDGLRNAARYIYLMRNQHDAKKQLAV